PILARTRPRSSTISRARPRSTDATPEAATAGGVRLKKVEATRAILSPVRATTRRWAVTGSDSSNNGNAVAWGSRSLLSRLVREKRPPHLSASGFLVESELVPHRIREHCKCAHPCPENGAVEFCRRFGCVRRYFQITDLAV